MAPVITSISPTSGAVGSNVQINGSGFIAGGVHGVVSFTGASATVIYSYTNTTIVCQVPPGATGPVFLELVNQNSNSVAFTVNASSTPHINTLTPSNGGIGIPVVIAGTNFGPTQGSSTVTFNGLTAMVTSWSATSITAIVPVGSTTGPVVVTVAGVASNGVTFTVTNPSNGGTSTPLNFLVYPIQNLSTPSIYVFATSDFDDQANGSIYGFKVEPIIPGRTPSLTRQTITYRDLGVCSVTAIISGYNQNVGADAPLITNQETFTIGTVAATGRLFTIVRGLTLTGQNLQYVLERPPAGGPMSIVHVRLEGRVELTPYA